MNEKDIITYIAGKASEEERRKVLVWIGENEANRKTFNRLKNLWVLSHLPQTKASEKDTMKFSSRLHRKIHIKHLMWWSAAASIILLISLTAYQKINYYQSQIEFLNQQQITELEYKTNKGIKGKITLPDGSVVSLNSDSYLKCPSKFFGDSRNIEFSGEGFFEVVKNPKKPMIIKLDNDIKVIVKGTKFNLSSYKNDKDVSALLLSGEITIIKNDKQGDKEIRVKPNEKIYIAKVNKQIDLTEPLEILPTIGWKDGWLIFDETPMDEVLRKLERWHGVQFVVEDKELLNQRFTARFKEESISQILEMMNKVSLISYELHDTTAVLRKY